MDITNHRSDTTMQVVALTHTGKIRVHNEDAFGMYPRAKPSQLLHLPEHGHVLVVADGMGGMNAGEIASKIAVDTVHQYFEQLFFAPQNIAPNQLYHLENAIQQAHQRIIEHGEHHPDTEGMGTTVVIAWIYEAYAYIGWSGDSRAYLFRPSQGLVQLTKDHSFVQTLVDKGELDPAQMRFHPRSNEIMQALGERDNPPKPDFLRVALLSEDQLLLCTDGLNGMLDNKVIEEVLLTQQNLPETAVEHLIQAANHAGGNDNITVLLAAMQTVPITTMPEMPSKRTFSLTTALAIFLLILSTAIFGIWVVQDLHKNKSDSYVTPDHKPTIPAKPTPLPAPNRDYTPISTAPDFYDPPLKKHQESPAKPPDKGKNTAPAEPILAVKVDSVIQKPNQTDSKFDLQADKERKNKQKRDSTNNQKVDGKLFKKDN